MTETDEIPEKWWITPYARSLSDFDYVRERERDYFSNTSTIEGMVIERKNLARRIDVVLLVSLLGAIVILAGGLPKEGQFSILGVQGPNRLITIQLIGIGVAGAFARYWQHLISLTMLSQIIDKIVGSLVGTAHIDFVTTRFDATFLWANLTRPRELGYQTSWPQHVIAASVPLLGLLIMTLHSAVVFYALWVSMILAINSASPNFVMTSLSVVSFAIAVLSIFLFLMSFLVPQPYKMSPDLRASLQAEKAEKARIESGAELPGLSGLSKDD